MGAIDLLRRQLAVELGPHGIRAVTLHSGGVPETTHEDWREAITQSFIDASMLKRVETLDDAGNVAAFVASDLARTMTATAPRRLSTSLPAARSTRPSGEQGDAKRDLDHDKAEKP